MSSVIMNAATIGDTIEKISKEIQSSVSDLDRFAIIGIQTRGVFIAERLRKKIETNSGKKISSGTLDITFYRDDLSTKSVLPVIKETKLDFDIESKTVLIVDDVIFTGRTVRAAIETLYSYGRVKKILLAVLVDRGNRELPIQPDYFGLKQCTEISDEINVHLVEQDGVDEVILYQKR